MRHRRTNGLRAYRIGAYWSARDGLAEMLATVETLLAGKFDKKANQLREAKLPILFDLADCTKFRCRIATQRWVDISAVD